MQEQKAGATLDKRAHGGRPWLCDSSWGEWRRHQLGELELKGDTSALCICLICDLGLESWPDHGSHWLQDALADCCGYSLGGREASGNADW